MRNFPTLAVVAATLLLVSAGNAAAVDLVRNAPPAFAHGGSYAVAVDFRKVTLSLTLDAAGRKAEGRARIEFHAPRAGFPLLDMVPDATAVTLNGQALAPSTLTETADPDGVTRLRVLKAPVLAKSDNVLEIAYRLSSNEVTFSGGNVRAGFFMDDLKEGGRGFFEQYGPANLEFDAYPMTLDVQVAGAAGEHVVYANGAVTPAGQGRWTVIFPEYYTTSSFYFHIAPAGRFKVAAGEHGGIPMTVYAESDSLASSGLTRARRVLEELETTYGPFPHAKVVIYVTPDGGGMEYAGATMTSLGALGHELTHSYFARGVMPANGNAGWIDEAIASWRDNGYPRARGEPSRSPVNLGGFPPYRRHTTQRAYSDGATFMSELDFMARDGGGLKPLLKALYAESGLQRIGVGDFQTFLEDALGRDLKTVFDRYVFGKGASAPEPMGIRPVHQRYSREQLLLYR